LIVWSDHGIVLAAEELPGGEIDSPKALRCPRTGGIILWFHLVQAGTAGVAFASGAGESFGFLHGIRVADAMTRDMSLFTDDDGSVWHIFRQEVEQQLYVALLDETLTRHDGDTVAMATKGLTRTPQVLKWDGLYWLLAANEEGEVQFATGFSLRGPWEVAGNPCIGSEAQIGSFFNSRPSCLVPVNGDAVIMVADDGGGRHVWLPFDFSHGVPELRWNGSWSPASWMTRNELRDSSPGWSVSSKGLSR
jgi:hypothetical protein